MWRVAVHRVSLGIVLRYIRLALATIALFALGAGCCSSPPKAPKVDGPSIRARSATIALLRRQTDTSWGETVCAGVFVSPWKIVTAKHCIAPAAAVPLERILSKVAGVPLELVGREVRFATYADWAEAKGNVDNAIQTTGTVAVMDPDNDLAMIVTETPSPNWASIRLSPLRWDEPVFAIGHPGSILAYTISRGHVSAPARDFEEDGVGKLTQATAPAWTGNSGGGLFDESGRLAGICSFGVEGVWHLQFFVHVDELRALIEGR